MIGATYSQEYEHDMSNQQRGFNSAEPRVAAEVNTDLRLTEPLYTSLSNIRRARKKPFERLMLQSLSVDAAPRLKMLKMTGPLQHGTAGKMLDVEALSKSCRTKLEGVGRGKPRHCQAGL
jgi:electron transfer flavoprotein beta subunit